MSTTRSTASAISGYIRNASATFVSGPVGTSVTRPGSASTVSAMKRAPWPGVTSMAGSIGGGPSRPDSPWISGAVRSGRTSGQPAPATIGTSVRPATDATTRAFRVTKSSVWLPTTVAIPSSSTRGSPAATSSATASSWPGSQSITTRWGVADGSADMARGLRRRSGLSRAGAAAGTLPLGAWAHAAEQEALERAAQPPLVLGGRPALMPGEQQEQLGVGQRGVGVGGRGAGEAAAERAVPAQERDQVALELEPQRDLAGHVFLERVIDARRVPQQVVDG